MLSAPMIRDDSLAGQVLASRYRLEAEIGRGGIGTVWRGLDSATGATLAVKVVPTVDHRGVRSENKVGRFLREARAMAKLKSPYVVQVFDHGACTTEDGDDVVYLTMELLVGEALRTRLKRVRRLDLPLAMKIMGHVGRAVALAHGRGIVHRDLKPANIFLVEKDDELVTKVLDFGMAKSVAAPLATVDAVQTELGRPLGTPYYMSPEQARGLDSVDHRTDLWAMGVIAYECVIGERPFRGKSLAKVFSDIAAGELPVPSKHGSVPPGFDAWFAKAVERDVQRRFQSAKLLIEELREVLVDVSTLSGTQSGFLNATVSDLSFSGLEGLSLAEHGDRTLRRAPKASLGNSFVERPAVFAEIDASIESHCRVITLTGAGGSGRTRTARQWALDNAGRFPGGAWLCALDHCGDADQMWHRLAMCLGVRTGDGDPIPRIGRALNGMGHVMVLLERPDRVRKHLAAALRKMLHLAPHAIFVVTTNKELSLPTERVIPVPDLPVPPYGENGTIESFKRYLGVELLLRRSMAFDRQLLTRQDQADAMASVARKTGGNPLAVEIIASRADSASMSEISSSLGNALLHEGGTHIIHPDTVVKSVTCWVVDQLPTPSRATLVQCAVFAGSFTLAAAEAVVDLSSWPQAAPVADIVTELASRGVLRRQESQTADPRFDMHPLVFDVVQGHFDEGKGLGPGDPTALRAATCSRHWSYYAQMGAPGALDALQRRGGWMRRGRYMADAENLAAAAKRALAERDGPATAACALAMAAVETLLGRHAKAAQRLVAAANADEVDVRSRLRCRIAQGSAAVAEPRLDAAAPLLESSASEARALGDEPLLASALLGLAEHRRAAARYDESRLLADQARQLWTKYGDRSGHAMALRTLAGCARAVGDLTGARRQLQEARMVFDELGEACLEADTLGELANVHADQRRPDQALAALEAEIGLRRELGDRHAEAHTLGRQGEIALDAGRVAEATQKLETAVGRCRELGACRLEGHLLGALASCRFASNAPEIGWETLKQAEQLLKSDAPRGCFELVMLWCRRAHIEAASGAPPASRHSLQQALQALGELGPAPLEVRRAMMGIHHALGLSAPPL
jgi:serine/threonine protein kinase/tetratricopeptide (TPR) repeat protein